MIPTRDFPPITALQAQAQANYEHPRTHVFHDTIDPYRKSICELLIGCRYQR